MFSPFVFRGEQSDKRTDDGGYASDRQDISMLSVDVVVVAYNSRQYLRACVEPLAGVPGVSILVVDNACPERSFEVVRAACRCARDSVGGTGASRTGCNGGWRAGGSEFVLFLNPDARLELDALVRLAHVLEIDPVAGVVGPRTHTRTGRSPGRFADFPRCGRRTVRPSSSTIWLPGRHGWTRSSETRRGTNVRGGSTGCRERASSFVVRRLRPWVDSTSDSSCMSRTRTSVGE